MKPPFPCKAEAIGIPCGSRHPQALRPLAVRLPPDLILWLDEHRGGEPRTTFLRWILREHIRRHQQARLRAQRLQRAHGPS